MYSFRTAFLCGFLLSASMLCAKIVTITDTDHFKSITQADQPVFITFSAEWCGACNHVKELLEQISDEAEFNNVAFVRVDIDKHKELSQSHNIIGVPTFVYMHRGAKKGQSIGLRNIVSFKDNLRDSLRTNFSMAKNTTIADIRVAAEAVDTTTMIPTSTKQPQPLSKTIQETEEPALLAPEEETVVIKPEQAVPAQTPQATIAKPTEPEKTAVPMIPAPAVEKPIETISKQQVETFEGPQHEEVSTSPVMPAPAQDENDLKTILNTIVTRFKNGGLYIYDTVKSWFE
ncbi:MAG TPA: thioredoxin domain-containing protein [Candidatus Babeliales bacterium]|nr:thioredoxin domain-containing protein [Candidatus Babeliales bacterium]